MELNENQKQYVRNLIGVTNFKTELIEYCHYSTHVYIIDESKKERYRIKIPRTAGQLTRFFQTEKNKTTF